MAKKKMQSQSETDSHNLQLSLTLHERTFLGAKIEAHDNPWIHLGVASH